MAVQTHQYPSNFMYLKRKEPEKNSTGFGGLNESSIVLSKIAGYGINPKKRGREIPLNYIDQSLNQSQPSVPQPQKIVRLDQYLQQSHNPSLTSTGLQLAFGEENLSHYSSPLCDDFAGSVSQYNKELDQLLQAQGDQLRRALAETLQSHYKLLLQHLEKSASETLNQKQTKLNQLLEHTTKLQTHLAQLQSESFAWQSQAIKFHTIANSIKTQIQQIPHESVVAEDAGSSCTERSRDEKLMCRVCRRKAVSVVVLPCRHLCLCEDCDVGEVKVCPVCDCVGSGSVRVFLC